MGTVANTITGSAVQKQMYCINAPILHCNVQSSVTFMVHCIHVDVVIKEVLHDSHLIGLCSCMKES